MRPQRISLDSSALAYGAFDFANSSISLIFHAYLFPLYFKTVLFGGEEGADAVWGFVFSGSVIAAAVIAPLLGRFADGRNRYSVFRGAALASFAGVFLLALAIGSNRVSVILTFVFANVGFYIASNVYDSLLTLVGRDQGERVRISTFAWSAGYLGGILCFLGVYLLQRQFGIEARAPYLFTAIFYAVFGWFALRLLRPHVKGNVRRIPIGLREMLRSLDRDRLRELLSYWLISDTINAVIFFTAIYASTQLHLSVTTIGGILLGVQIIAVPGTWIFGWIATKLGILRTLRICVAIWLLVVGVLAVGRSLIAVVALTLLTGLVIGATQALMRAQYSSSVDRERTSELFGWYAIVTESSSIVAPAVFGGLVLIFRSERIAMAALAIPLLIGGMLLRGSVSPKSA